MLGTIWTMLKETVTAYIDDNCLSRGAAIAYFIILYPLTLWAARLEARVDQ